MSRLTGRWVGAVSGTNIGNLTIDLGEECGKLQGTLRFNDHDVGLSIHDVAGHVEGNAVSLEVTPSVIPDGVEMESGVATAQIQPDGSLSGQWEMKSGTAGTFYVRKQPDSALSSPQDAATPGATAIRYEKESRVPSCLIDHDVLRRVFKDLSAGSDQAARLEQGKRSETEVVVGDESGTAKEQPDYARTRGLYSVLIVARGEDGEQVASIDPSLLDEGNLPKPLKSIEFNIGNWYQLTQGSSAANTAHVKLDFTRPPLVDFSNPSLEPTPNESVIQVAGNDSMWVAGVYEKVLSTLKQGQTKTGWLHSKYTYELFLFLVGLPGVLSSAAIVAGKFRTELLPFGMVSQLAVFLFVLWLALVVFRLAFSAIRWLLPFIEFSVVQQPLHRQIRLTLSVLSLGVISSLAGAGLWYALFS